MGLLHTTWLGMAQIIAAASEVVELEEKAEHHGFGIGTDILGSNLINIGLILALLIYLIRNVLLGILDQRRAAIQAEISEAEQRKQSAIEKLADQQQKLAQAQQEAERIKQQAEANAEKLRTELLGQIDGEIERLRASADRDLGAEQDRIVRQLRDQLVEQVLAQVEIDLPQQLNEERQHRLIDQSIQLLAGRS